jgi:hypothetical protein
VASLPALIGNGISQESVLPGAASCGGDMRTNSKTEKLKITAKNAKKFLIKLMHLKHQQSPSAYWKQCQLEAIKNTL